MQTKTANVVHVRDDKVMRIVFYFDRERAFADLGLPSEAGSPRS
jgi:ketosteroid isomerase-like protein